MNGTTYTRGTATTMATTASLQVGQLVLTADNNGEPILAKSKTGGTWRAVAGMDVVAVAAGRRTGRRYVVRFTDGTAAASQAPSTTWITTEAPEGQAPAAEAAVAAEPVVQAPAAKRPALCGYCTGRKAENRATGYTVLASSQGGTYAVPVCAIHGGTTLVPFGAPLAELTKREAVVEAERAAVLAKREAVRAQAAAETSETAEPAQAPTEAEAEARLAANPAQVLRTAQRAVRTAQLDVEAAHAELVRASVAGEPGGTVAWNTKLGRYAQGLDALAQAHQALREAVAPGARSQG